MGGLRGQLWRFATAGLAGLLADVAVLYLALFLSAGVVFGRVLSFLAAVWVTWQINRRYTFAGARIESPWRQFGRYLLAMLGGGLVNFLAYTAAVLLLPAHPLTPAAAVALGSLAGMGVNFTSSKLLVFRR